jgi:hypothetical protein
LGLSLTLEDLKDYDKDMHKSLTRERANPSGQFHFELHSRATHPVETVPLKPGGGEIKVTRENVDDYIRRWLDFRFRGEFKDQLKAFVEGFHSLIPRKEISMFRPDELGVLISGVPKIDIDAFEKHVLYDVGYSRDHPVIQRFFEVFRGFEEVERETLLAFVTGADKQPAEGFESFAKTGGAFKIIPWGGTNRLPEAQTCERIFKLPPYETKEEMKTKILLALQLGPDAGFALA